MIVHELGHALMGLRLTRGRVSVVMGTYRKLDKPPILTLWRLDITVQGNLPWWQSGYSRSHEIGISWPRHVAIILGGPIIPVIASAVMASVALVADLPELLIFFMLIFTCMALLMLPSSLIPRRRPVFQQGTRVPHNDGALIMTLLKKRSIIRSG